MYESEIRAAEIETILPLEKRIDTLNGLAWQLRYRNRKQARHMCVRARELSQTGEFADHPYTPGLATALTYSGMLAALDFETDRAPEDSLQAMRLLEGLPLLPAHSLNHIVLSWIHIYLGEYSTALDYALSAQHMAREIADPSLVAYAFDLLGGIYAKIGDAERSQTNHMAALQIANDLPYPELDMIFSNNLADSLYHLGHYDTASAYSQRALAVATELDCRFEELVLDSTLADIYIKQHNLAGAERYIVTAMSKYKQYDLNTPFLITQLYLSLANLKKEQRDFASAEFNFMQGCALAQQYRFKYFELMIHHQLSELYEQTGQTDRALAEYKQFHALQMTVFGSDTLQKISLLEARYQIQLSRQEAENYRLRNTELEQRVRARTAELRATNVALQKASRAKDEFMAAMSHELRTPLNSILGLSEALQNGLGGPLNDHQAQTVETILHSGRNLLALINDLLDYTRFQSGENRLNLAPCRVEQIVRSAERALKKKAEGKHQTITLEISPATIALTADEKRLRQVLVNLLDNAIKFTPPNGQITVRAAERTAPDRVEISVTDNGIGIPEADLPRLFQPFVQLDARLAREYEGTGLGLALVKALVELHGGRVSVQSTQGQGSCFTVVLPTQSSPAPQPQS